VKSVIVVMSYQLQRFYLFFSYFDYRSLCFIGNIIYYGIISRWDLCNCSL